MKGVILAGGLGTRLRPLTHTGAKQLIPIANKPVIVYCIEDLVRCGITEIAIIVGYTPERIQSVMDTIGSGERWGISISYIEQDAPRGIAHALSVARNFVGNEPCVLYLGDNLYQDDVSPIIKSFEENTVDLGVVLSAVEDPRPYGVAVLDQNGRMTDIVEKPKNPPSNLVVTGIYYFSPAVFRVIENLNPSGRGEYEISDTIHMMIADPKTKFASAEISGWWDDTGTADAVLLANHKILSKLTSNNLGFIEDDVRIIGQISIGKNSRIRSGTVIRGPVIIDDDCMIGPGYLGPYTAIGPRCTIRGGEIESSILVSDATVNLNPSDRIIDSLIGKHTTITSSSHKCPSGTRLIIGENSEVFL
jgi:glucose-1-phosphate thymidylyltransferase